MKKCEVCGELTTHCPSSPFTPCSYWRCLECTKNKRISYEELLRVLISGNAKDFDERMFKINEALGEGYANKFFLPTINFFKKTKEQAWKDAMKFEVEVTNDNISTREKFFFF